MEFHPAKHGRGPDSEAYAMIYETWNSVRRPFYNIYPAVNKCLLNTRLNIRPLDIMPENNWSILCVCFAKGHEASISGIGDVRNILFGAVCTGEEFAIVALPGAIKDGDEWEFQVSAVMPAGKQFSELLENEPESAPQITKMFCGITLLSRDERFCEPILLQRDRSKTLTPEQHEKAIERARNRGRNGFTVGGSLEVSPHVRRPHFAIRWTGKGGKVPRLVPVKGCVVKRTEVYPIPTGHLGKEDPCHAT